MSSAVSSFPCRGGKIPCGRKQVTYLRQGKKKKLFRSVCVCPFFCLLACFLVSVLLLLEAVVFSFVLLDKGEPIILQIESYVMLFCIYIQVMRKHVMVRVGGGWDTLERYFDKHDPCKVTGKATSRQNRMIKRMFALCF